MRWNPNFKDNYVLLFVTEACSATSYRRQLWLVSMHYVCPILRAASDFALENSHPFTICSLDRINQGVPPCFIPGEGGYIIELDLGNRSPAPGFLKLCLRKSFPFACWKQEDWQYQRACDTSIPSLWGTPQGSREEGYGRGFPCHPQGPGAG